MYVDFIFIYSLLIFVLTGLGESSHVQHFQGKNKWGAFNNYLLLPMILVQEIVHDGGVFQISWWGEIDRKEVYLGGKGG